MPTSSAATSCRRSAPRRKRADGDQREWLYRLRKTCESGLVAAELAEKDDELENALLAARVTFKGEELPLRSALAQLAVLPDYKDRDELGELQQQKSARVQRCAARAAARLRGARGRSQRGARPGGAQRGGEADLPARARSRCWSRRATRSKRRSSSFARRGSSGCSAPSARQQPSSAHMGYVRRLSPLDATYTKDRATDVCLATLTALGFDLAADRNIQLDLDDRPQKSPRACVIASDPPKVVHLITRAQGGLHDYQAFMHEAGHALHYAGCDPNLPYTFRRICARSRAHRDLLVHLRGDHPRAGVARRALRARATRRPGPTPRARRSSRRCCSAATPRSCGSSSGSGRASTTPARRATTTRRSSRRRPASAIRATAISPTWTAASTRPTTSARGSATRSCVRTSSTPSARTGGAARRRGRSCARSSPRARGRRARRSPRASAIEPYDTGPLIAELTQ